MFKKVIKIILILLAIFLLILGIIWLIGRHTAQKNGNTPLSFKQFIGLSSKTSSNGTNGTGGGTLTSNFGNTGSNNGVGNSGQGTGGAGGNSGGIGNTTGNSNIGGINGIGSNSIGNGINIISAPTISQFTSGGITATNGYSGGASGNSTTISTPTGNNTQNNSLTTAGAPANTAPVCGTADTTITFTPAQIAELNTLQNRFYALAQTLHTDADVATEVANHDAFAVKAQQMTELYNYCEAKLPLITDPQLQQHLPTPFWQQWLASDVPANLWNTSGRQDQDSLTFLSFNAGQSAHLTDIHNNTMADLGDRDTSGITGPYGLLNFGSPQSVLITGSTVKGNSQKTGIFGIVAPPDPLHLTSGALPGETITSNPADYLLLLPVVERILRINLW